MNLHCLFLVSSIKNVPESRFDYLNYLLFKILLRRVHINIYLKEERLSLCTYIFLLPLIYAVHRII